MDTESLPSISPEQVNGWYMGRQRLGPRASISQLATLCADVGWLNAPTDPTPYLSVRARVGNYPTRQLDSLVYEENALVEVVGIQGVPMLVPRSHLNLALHVNDKTSTHALQQASKLLGFPMKNIKRLQDCILALLREMPMDQRVLRNRIPAGWILPWGRMGAKQQFGSGDCFHDALGQLVEEGEVVRMRTGNRLDSPVYVHYRSQEIFTELGLRAEIPEEAVWERLAEYYFTWYGPASFEDFVWWSGLTITQARAALSGFYPPLRALSIEGVEGEYLATEWTAYSIATFQQPPEPEVAFLPPRDPYHTSFRFLAGRFLKPEHCLRARLRWRGKPLPEPLIAAPIIIGGGIAGVWEWNQEHQIVDWLLFEPALPPAEANVKQEAEALTEFVCKEELTTLPIHYGHEGMTYRIHELATLAETDPEPLEDSQISES